MTVIQPLSLSHTYHYRMLSFKPLTESIDRLTRQLSMTGQLYFGNDNKVTVKSDPNVATIVMYLGEQRFPQHCDNIHDREGNFDCDKNSQKKNSPTYSITLGATRRLHFQLVRYPTKTERQNGKRKPISIPHTANRATHYILDLDHNSLFMLHPDEEEPMIRPIYPYRKTFWQHYVEAQKEMSIGVVLRACTHFRKVYHDTGMLVLTDKEHEVDSKRYEKNYELLDEYFSPSSKEKKDAKDEEIMHGWAQLNAKYF